MPVAVRPRAADVRATTKPAVRLTLGKPGLSTHVAATRGIAAGCRFAGCLGSTQDGPDRERGERGFSGGDGGIRQDFVAIAGERLCTTDGLPVDFGRRGVYALSIPTQRAIRN